MIDSIGSVVGISPLIVAVLLLVFQVLSQSRDIKNKNIISSRLKWLQELKVEFSNYNKHIVTFNQSLMNNIDVQGYANELEENKIKVLLKFKSHQFTSVPEYESLLDLFEGTLLTEFKEIDDENDCEKVMFNLMEIINNYYISLSVKKENEDNNHNASDDLSPDILLDSLLQFQICLGKIEWIKINYESKLLKINMRYFLKKENSPHIKMLKSNLERIFKSFKGEKEVYDKEELSDNCDQSDENKKSDNTTEDATDYVKNNWNDDETVGQNLEKILLKIDNEIKLTKSNLKTVSGKRYIYSSIAAIHPSGKSFVNPRKVFLPKEKINVYLETNFSIYQGKRVAERMVKELLYS